MNYYKIKYSEIYINVIYTETLPKVLSPKHKLETESKKLEKCFILRKPFTYSRAEHLK